MNVSLLTLMGVFALIAVRAGRYRPIPDLAGDGAWRSGTRTPFAPCTLPQSSVGFVRSTRLVMKETCAALFAIAFVLAADSSAFDTGAESRDREREEMVRTQIIERGVSDTATLRAMRTVPRHLFVQPERSGDAYDDRPLPIGYGQTISQPYIVAYMTELVKLKRGQRVLEIGTGSGYQAAVLAHIVDSVFTIEIITELATPAAERLRTLSYKNVVVKNADGYYGWPEKGPFDAIVVTAAAEYIPPPLIAQLMDGGLMIIPVGTPFLVQTLTLVEKRGKQTTTRSLIPVRFVPLTRGK